MKKLLLITATVCILSLRDSPASQQLPPLPRDVAELKFGELFQGPIGARGLQISDKSNGLDGKRVRMLGHLVRQDHPIPGLFLLTAIPVQLHDEHYGLADDLPAATVFVSTPFAPQTVIDYKPGPCLITGILRVGNREEADGRISIFRIELDQPRKTFRRNLQKASKTGETRLDRKLQQ